MKRAAAIVLPVMRVATDRPVVYVREPERLVGAVARWAFFWGVLVGTGTTALAMFAVLVWPVP